MLATLNSLNAHNLSIYQPILIILESKFIVHRAFSHKKISYNKGCFPLFRFRAQPLCIIHFQNFVS